MAHSSKSKKRNKTQLPSKPYPDFPLTPHPTGRWCKKIRGKLFYFGRWGNKQAGKVVPLVDVPASAQKAVDLYNDQRDDLHAGRTPRKSGGGLTTRDLCNRFLTAKRHLLETGEITERTFRDYHATCERLIAVFGRSRLAEDLAAEDFGQLRAELAKNRGPVALGNEVGRVRVVFKFAYDSALIDKPIRYGQEFRKPSRRTLRKARAAKGKRTFEADELRRIIDAAGQPLKAMILLGVNAGLGQSDCASLPLSAVNLKRGWIDYPRPKTGIERHCPLWPITVQALREAIDKRPQPKEDADAELVFVTKYGKRWVRLSDNENVIDKAAIDSVSQEFRKVLATLGIEGGRSFYGCRRTFRTVADASKDQPAVDHIMGHARDDMASLYREGIDDERLRAVVDVVHAWLFGRE